MKAGLAAFGSWLFIFACDHLNLFSVPSYEVSASRELFVQLALSAAAIASSVGEHGTCSPLGAAHRHPDHGDRSLA